MSRRWSTLEFIVEEFHAGKAVRLRPLPATRQEFELVARSLAAWEPIVLAACAYYDAVASGTEDVTEQHRALWNELRKSGLVGREEESK